jgi:ABC-type branched-subunit amino acid transport system substrate-binding protein
VAAGLLALGPLRDHDLDAGVAATRSRLRDAVAAVDGQGVTGRIRFDRVGDRVTAPAVMVVEQGPAGLHQARFYAEAQ